MNIHHNLGSSDCTRGLQFVSLKTLNVDSIKISAGNYLEISETSELIVEYQEIFMLQGVNENAGTLVTLPSIHR